MKKLLIGLGFIVALFVGLVLGSGYIFDRYTLISVDIKRDGQDIVSYKVELASTPGERQQGLMYRASLPEDEGLFFVMPEERIQKFWMKNVSFPIDIIFIDKNFKVVGVKRGEPFSEEELSVETPSSYVLEINPAPGLINVGDEVRVEAELPEPIPDIVGRVMQK